MAKTKVKRGIPGTNLQGDPLYFKFSIQEDVH
jgi:hypothetical protein